MIKLADTKLKYSTDEASLKQFNDMFGNVDKYVSEFNPVWDEMLPHAIKAHSKYGFGEYAGSGCVDYNEAKALYIITRVTRPKIVIELGYAAGISTSFIARALEMNGPGQVHTIDLSPEHWDVCNMFKSYREQETIVQYHTTDAVSFITKTKLQPNLTFTDATHLYEPTKQAAEVLLTKWPHAIHLYHEWGMSYRSNVEEQSYISMTNQLGNHYERDAFEDVFGDKFLHGGFYGSCGLGVVMPT
jgi:predicted O-methyltransferase YrrM